MDAKTKEEELELLHRVQNSGDPAAFEELFRLYHQKLKQIAYQILQDQQDAEEVVLEAFIRAYRAIGNFRGDASFGTWMHRITSNLAKNRYHWNKRRGAGAHISIHTAGFSDPDSGEAEKEWDLPDDRMQPDRELELDELENDIESVISTLPEKFRIPLRQRYSGKKAYLDITGELGVPLNTVKTRIKRARELIREKLVAQQHCSRSSL